MMKSMLKSLMSVAAAALALTSCSTDATDEAISKGELKTLVVNATIDQTRTTMADDHVKLNWSDGDMIKLYIGGSAVEADAKPIYPLKGGTITGVNYEGNETVYARYTSYEYDTKSVGVDAANIEIPKEQTQTDAGVFAGVNLPMVASAPIENGKVNLTFKPVGCVLVFNVYDQRNTGEKIKSIKFETSAGCCGYTNCSLIADPFVYEAFYKNTSATVMLTNAAPIGTAKPGNTQTGENQVYLVVAPVNYTAATFTVTTDAGNTYTFTSASGIDCSQNSARVVNLNLARAAEMQPAIEVPTVPQQKSDGGTLVINGINFKNIATDGLNFNDVVGVYSNPELNTPLTDSWITFAENAELFSSGTLNCVLAANTTTAKRTAYIGIKCGNVQAAIAITQVAPGASTDKYFVKVTENLTDWAGKYLIVYESSDTEAHVWNLTDAAGNYITAGISNLGILSDAATTNCIVSISKSGEGYLLCATAGANSEKYIYHTGASGNKVYFGTQSKAEGCLNTITIENDGSANIVSSGRIIRYLTADKRFRYYKTTSTGVASVQLYKLQE